jgi:hypothetical protein
VYFTLQTGITNYRATSSSGSYNTGTTSPILVSGLSSNTSYTFTVKSTNTAATIVWGTSSVLSIPVITIPPSVYITSATPYTTSNTLVYSPNDVIGPGTITYTAYAGAISQTGTTLSITIPGLTSNTDYIMKVTGTNSSGTGTLYIYGYDYTSGTIPNVPTILTPTTNLDYTLNVNFSQPTEGSKTRTYTAISSSTDTGIIPFIHLK